MLNRNKRLVIFTITVLGLLVASTFLPASAQLSQWRSLNPIRDGIIGPSGLGPNLYSIHLLSPTVGWAVGGTCDIYGTRSGDGCPGVGYVLSWDGAKWRQVLTPPNTGTLASVFAVSANDVWAVGLDATIIHWDGVSWVTATSPVGTIDIFSVFVLPGGMDGWAVGVDSGAAKILRWSGTWPFGAWSAFTAPASAQELRGVFLLSPTEGWAVGTGGTIFRWDGAGWIDISAGSPTNEDLFSIFALSPTDAWAVGAESTIIRWNGASWTGPMIAPTGNTIDYRSIHMVSPTDGWISGKVNPTTKEGILLRWDGVAWSIIRSFVTVNLNDVFMLPGGTAGAAVGDSETIIRWDGRQWDAQTSPTSDNLYDVHLISSDDGWAVGQGGNIFRWNGISWHHYETLPSGEDLFGLFMETTSDGWAVGAPASAGTPPTILRWNGISWTVVTPPGVAVGETLHDVFMLSATQGWAVGTGSNGPSAVPATVLKWDGSLWTSVPSGTSTGTDLYAVYMLSTTDGWAVGRQPGKTPGPLIVRWNGLAWSTVTAPAGVGVLLDIYMLSPTDGWAVGYPGTGTDGQATIIHWDGVQWTRVPAPLVGSAPYDGFLTAVKMTSPTDGWAVGRVDDGASLITHWDGLTWNVVSTPPIPPSMSVSLYMLFMVSQFDGWIVGADGLILHYGPEVVPGTTTSMTTSTSFTTVISTVTSGTTSATSVSTTGTSATTATAASTWGVPGFPIESILAGLMAGVAVLAVLRHRQRRS